MGRGNSMRSYSVWVRLPLIALLLMIPKCIFGQSIIFPKILDQHYIHAATKPIIGIFITEGMKELGVPKIPAVLTGIIGPVIFSRVRIEQNVSGYWKTKEALYDSIADIWITSTGVVPLQFKKKTGLGLLTLGLIVYFPLELHKKGIP